MGSNYTEPLNNKKYRHKIFSTHTVNNDVVFSAADLDLINVAC